MDKLYELKDKLKSELDKIARKPDLSAGDLDAAHKLTDTIKNINKICMMEEDGYSEGRYYDDGMDYGLGTSLANRGRHLVRSHYSRDGGSDGYSERRDARGRYSHDGGRTEMMHHLEMAMETANEQDRENIKRWMRQLENA